MCISATRSAAVLERRDRRVAEAGCGQPCVVLARRRLRSQRFHQKFGLILALVFEHISSVRNDIPVPDAIKRGLQRIFEDNFAVPRHEAAGKPRPVQKLTGFLHARHLFQFPDDAHAQMGTGHGL